MTHHTKPHDWRWRLEQQEVNCIGYRRPYEVLVANSDPTHMVNCHPVSSCVFVKAYDFFISQNGHIQRWGKNWKPVVALDIEHARQIGCSMFPAARPYEQQAK